jgi:biopolymer transport protein ExbD
MPGYGYIRERKQPPGPSAKPQITSFADVTLVLLVIFLVSASAAVQMIALELPEAVHTKTEDINLAVTISVSNQPPETEEGAKPAPAPEGEKRPWLYYFEDDTTGIAPKNLWTVLKATKGDSEWPFALIRADRNAPCEKVSILIQCLQGLGVDRIAFVIATEEQKTPDDDES